MYGGYEGGWNPGDYLTGEVGDFPMTRYQNKAGHDYLDFKQWSLGKWADAGTRDTMLKNIYLSAKAMKFHPQITKDLRKTYGLVASAAMRAMSPEAKYLLKQKMSPYSELKKRFAEQSAQDKASWGIIPRKGLAGRIKYWNAIQDTDINNVDDALDDIYALDDGVHKLSDFQPKDIYAGNYAAYKAKLRKKAANRRALLDRMTEDQRKDYKHRLRVYQAARTAMTAARKRERERVRNIESLAWGKMTPKDWAEDYRDAITEAIASKPKYANVRVEDIMPVLSDPKASLFKSYMAANSGIAQQPLRRTPDKDMGLLSLTNREAVDWKSPYVPYGPARPTPEQMAAANANNDMQTEG